LTLRDIANPYRPGEPVTEPAMLFGRQEAADWLELQITGGARTVVLNGAPLIGKTSFVKHVGAIQNLQAYNLLVSLKATQPLVEELDKQQSKETKSPTTINTVLQAVIDQLTPQLSLLDLISPEPTEPLSQTASELRKLFAQANKRLGPERLVLFFDDLHLLFTDDMSSTTYCLHADSGQIEGIRASSIGWRACV
jgi:hypothetical protein